MTWAARRRKLIIAILIVCSAALVAVVFIATAYRAPSCMDNAQNQGENGIDCGGPCPYLCSADETAPRITFVRPVSPTKGRTDVIAYVSNENADAAAHAVPYTLELYDSHLQIITKREGIISLPAAATVPLFISNAYVGKAVITQAFITFNTGSIKWQRSIAKQILPRPSNIQIDNSPTPKISATLSNPTATALYNETVIATVFDVANNAIGASQTVISSLPGQGSAPVIFTWNQAFEGVPVRVEILPAPSL